MFQKMEKERTVAREWNEVKVKTVSKPGSILLMDNKRGLFITDIISKIYEKVVKNRNEENIRKYVSEFQTGGMKERGTHDNILLLSEIIRQKRKAGKKCYIVFGDAVKCFDKLWLKDSLVELYKAGCNPQDIEMIYKMNRDTVIEVETPSGTTKKMKVGEIVKQGTVLGPTLCCVVTDQINKIGEPQDRNLGHEYVAILIFVDDVMSAGNAEEARAAIRNCKEMERKKKFTYGLKKTKVMVMNTGKEKEEVIEEEVKAGKVNRTDEYKYIGFHLNKQGNCLHNIRTKGKKMKVQIVALKSIASYSNVGESYIQVRLLLYELCILQSLLYGLEAWNQQTKSEIKELEKYQAKSLCKILELPRTTPYIALLNELGIWRIEERIKYRKIMMMQNILKSDDSRLIKRVVLDQKESGDNDTFYATTEKMLEKYQINIEEIVEMKKSELKRKVKEKITEEMKKIVQKAAKKMTKMRFVEESKFERKEYIRELEGKECVRTLKTRMNMIPIYGNYKGDLSKERLCPYCKKADDTTEHLIECNRLGSTIHQKEDLLNTNNAEGWIMINERIQFNLQNRRKGIVH